ncbi:MAG: HNH endonuclease [bacterium]|nr:HNH endonuclease [bacterium]
MGRSSSGLNSHVLMLNAHYAALRVIDARRAFSLLFKRDRHDQPVAEVIRVEDGRYVSYNFDDWCELSEFKREFEPADQEWVRTIRIEIAVPRIIRVLSFNRLPRQEVRFNRRNLYARDQNLCQYCGKKFSSTDLSLDHVVPRSRNGPTTWENVVCACLKCNVRKGGRTPSEAHMKLIKLPAKPRFSPVMRLALSSAKYRSWKQFLDTAYWNVELK